MRRWLTFNVVGAAGFGLQLLALEGLLRTGLALVPAVTLAVLLAVSHNFVWHERLTWADRPRHHRLGRWLGFNLSTGLVSVVTNVAGTSVLVTTLDVPPVAANVVAVGIASILNYTVSDRLVFSGNVAVQARRDPVPGSSSRMVHRQGGAQRVVEGRDELVFRHVDAAHRIEETDAQQDQEAGLDAGQGEVDPLGPAPPLLDRVAVPPGHELRQDGMA